MNIDQVKRCFEEGEKEFKKWGIVVLNFCSTIFSTCLSSFLNFVTFPLFCWLKVKYKEVGYWQVKSIGYNE